MTVLQAKQFEWSHVNAELYQSHIRLKLATDAGSPPDQLEPLRAAVRHLEEAATKLARDIELLGAAP